jgi:hypothetical protein
MNKINEQLFYNHWVNNLEEINNLNRQLLTECYFYLHGHQFKGICSTEYSILQLYKELNKVYLDIKDKYIKPSDDLIIEIDGVENEILEEETNEEPTIKKKRTTVKRPIKKTPLKKPISKKTTKK